MLTDTNLKYQGPEIWGGIECTINRVSGKYRDQLQYAGHYTRIGDIGKIAALGIKKLRYPILWEFHQKQKEGKINWDWTTGQLNRIRAAGITPIAGLLHHGSGPEFTQLDDPDFPSYFAAYAKQVAIKFPWLEYYTPVNEPLTTARFSGLYGYWHPHLASDHAFASMLINQIRATVLAMRAIREINPGAKLVQTEDLSFIHSTPALAYQAFFENQRRWLTFDLLCGKVNEDHILWNYFLDSGILREDLVFFQENPCPPDIMGFNYYITSERYLDENIADYPHVKPGTNGKHVYADTEAVRKGIDAGLAPLLTEAWERYQLPMAVTECHLACSRDEQLRWFYQSWNTCKDLNQRGIHVSAITAWALMGAFDWNSLLTSCNHHYEPGVFDISNDTLRPTAMARLVKELATKQAFNHPLIEEEGWWEKNKITRRSRKNQSPPLLIIGKTGTLGTAFARLCEHRSIHHTALSRHDADICSEESIRQAIDRYKPWAVINATGYVRVDDAESNREECFQINAKAPQLMAGICGQKGIPFITFSSDLVFDGSKQVPYLESDLVKSLNVYGESKLTGERWVREVNEHALIIRSSSFFGPWDRYNFVYDVINKLKQDREFVAAGNVIVSPTYVPDLVNTVLDLLIDEETGIWHISNSGRLSWYELAERAADAAGLTNKTIIQKEAGEMGWKAQRPLYSVLKSEKGIRMPSVENALERYFHEQIA